MKLFNKRFITVLYVIFDIIAVTVASLIGALASRSVNHSEIGSALYVYALISNAIITVAMFMLFKMYSNLDIYVGAFEGVKLISACSIVTVLHIIEMQFILKLDKTVDLAYLLIFLLLLVAFTMVPRYFKRVIAAMKCYIFNYKNGKNS